MYVIKWSLDGRLSRENNEWRTDVKRAAQFADDELRSLVQSLQINLWPRFHACF